MTTPESLFTLFGMFYLLFLFTLLFLFLFITFFFPYSNKEKKEIVFSFHFSIFSSFKQCLLIDMVNVAQKDNIEGQITKEN